MITIYNSQQLLMECNSFSFLNLDMLHVNLDMLHLGCDIS